jgi:hypothetical protein
MFFDGPSSKRIAANTVRQERTPRNKPAGRRRHVTPRPPASGSVLAAQVTLGQISVASTTTTHPITNSGTVGPADDNTLFTIDEANDYVVIVTPGWYLLTLNTIVTFSVTPTVVNRVTIFTRIVASATTKVSTITIILPEMDVGAGSLTDSRSRTVLAEFEEGDELHTQTTNAGSNSMTCSGSLILMPIDM